MQQVTLFFLYVLIVLATIVILAHIFASVLQWYIDKHPLIGQVIGKAQKEEYFLLLIEDSKGHYGWVSVKKEFWDQTNLQDSFIMNTKRGDSYYLSM